MSQLLQLHDFMLVLDPKMVVIDIWEIPDAFVLLVEIARVIPLHDLSTNAVVEVCIIDFPETIHHSIIKLYRKNKAI